MKPSKYLSVIIFVSAIWFCLAVESLAQVTLKLPRINVNSPSEQSSVAIAQNQEDDNPIADANKDLKLREIVITPDSSDKSLLSVQGSIDNYSEQTHFIYYIVAKFVAKDTSIKQAIIPVNSQIEPGKSAKFNYEISTESIKLDELNQVKSVVVKYEYR